MLNFASPFYDALQRDTPQHGGFLCTDTNTLCRLIARQAPLLELLCGPWVESMARNKLSSSACTACIRGLWMWERTRGDLFRHFSSQKRALIGKLWIPTPLCFSAVCMWFPQWSPKAERLSRASHWWDVHYCDATTYVTTWRQIVCTRKRCHPQSRNSAIPMVLEILRWN